MPLTHASHPDPFEANGMPPTYDSMHQFDESSGQPNCCLAPKKFMPFRGADGADVLQRIGPANWQSVRGNDEASRKGTPSTRRDSIDWLWRRTLEDENPESSEQTFRSTLLRTFAYHCEM